MKCLVYLLVTLLLCNMMISSKNLKKSCSKNSLTVKNSHLPSHWATGHRSSVAIQINSKEHAARNKRLVSTHKYRDTTKQLLKKSIKHR